MYNEQIESLISAALADGMLTEKEKQVLFKKAQSQGIDLDEFEMVLDARLVELEKAEKAKAAAAAPKSNKLGDVKKCPNCGENLKEQESIDLDDEFVELAEEMNTDVEFISTETEEGMQIFRAFGGIAAVLRYYVDY